MRVGRSIHHNVLPDRQRHAMPGTPFVGMSWSVVVEWTVATSGLPTTFTESTFDLQAVTADARVQPFVRNLAHWYLR